MDRPIARAPRTDVQAPIWLIDPQQGAAVGHTFNAYLAGTVDGGAARLRVLRSGVVINDQAVMLSAAAPQLGEAQVQLTLTPGRYTVVAYLPRPDGADRDADSHDVTVP